MPVSIIIPSLNSPIIDRVLAHLRQQTAVADIGEILVVGKDEKGLIAADGLVRLLDTGDPVSAPAARNIGIRETQHERLVFLDSDCLPQETWLAAHLAAQAAGHAVVGGGVLPAGTNYWSLSYNLTLFHEFLATGPAGFRDYLPTLNLSVDRRVIEVVGELEEELARGQDIDWTARMRAAGFRPYFWPEAAVFHAHNRTTLSRVWRDCARSGYHMRRVRLQHGQAFDQPIFFLRRPRLLLWLSPAIASWVTLRIVGQRPRVFGLAWHTLPAIYLTKIAWCWGASRQDGV